MRVFVTGCYDLLHSGHVEFFRQASMLGDLYVGIGSDRTILHYKNHRPFYPEKERLFMVKSIRYVKDAYINEGDGVIDFLGTLDIVCPDIFIVNEDGSSEEKERICRERGIEYKVLKRVPAQGLEARSSTDIKSSFCMVPTRLDLAGTWIDQPYVSQYAPGWAITISLQPSFPVRERCGLSTSTRNEIRKIWPFKLPDMDPEMLARLVFCFENNPERGAGHISGAQDAIGICVPGLSRHYYNNHFWPEKIETCNDGKILDWLEHHVCMIPMSPRSENCNVTEGRDINRNKVLALANAAESCWNSIMTMDLERFAKHYRESFEAQVAMFPAMIQGEVQEYINKYSAMDGVMAWKMPGAGGGGYLALVVEDVEIFCNNNSDAILLKIRRQ